MKKIAALIALAGIAAAANAQPGNRNAIVYGARLAGTTDWSFGGITAQSTDTNPLVFEIGVFFFRAQGVGHSTAVYKTYIDGVSTAGGDSASIVDDVSNGASPLDGRVDVFNNGAQNQGVFTNRNAAISGSGFRISSSGDTADGSAAGGISVKQDGPQGAPPFREGDGLLGYRFNVTLACTTVARDVLIKTPGFDATTSNRINSYSSYNSLGDNTSTEFKTSTTSDSLTIHASWVPAPSTLALLGLGGLIAGRRRR
jgi:hypothetical protein